MPVAYSKSQLSSRCGARDGVMYKGTEKTSPHLSLSTLPDQQLEDVFGFLGDAYDLTAERTCIGSTSARFCIWVLLWKGDVRADAWSRLE